MKIRKKDEWSRKGERQMLIYMTMMEERYHSLFETLYYAYRSSMFRIAYAVLHDHHLAEDALSEAFLNIARNMQKISAMSGQEREKYFVIIIRNCAIDIYRKRQTEWDNLTELETLPEQVQGASIDEAVFSQDSYQRLLEAIASLPETYKDVMQLYYIYDHSAAEIAELLQLKENTVAARLSRGRKKLMETLTEQERMEK